MNEVVQSFCFIFLTSDQTFVWQCSWTIVWSCRQALRTLSEVWMVWNTMGWLRRYHLTCWRHGWGRKKEAWMEEQTSLWHQLSETPLLSTNTLQQHCTFSIWKECPNFRKVCSNVIGIKIQGAVRMFHHRSCWYVILLPIFLPYSMAYTNLNFCFMQYLEQYACKTGFP